MKKKSFVFLVIVVGLLLAGCGKAETNSTQLSAEDTSLIGKWEIDYDLYKDDEKMQNFIFNMDFLNDKKVILDLGEKNDAMRMDLDYVDDGKKIVTSFAGETPVEYPYKFSGKNMELVTSEDGHKIMLRKVSGNFKNPYTEESDSKQSITAPQKEYTFTAGNYTVEEDIPSGKYDVEWVSGSGNCFAGDMGETFGEGEYRIKEYKNLTLTKTDTIKVSGTLEIKFISK